MEILISTQAYWAIQSECYKNGVYGIETGGILIGPRIYPNVITDVVNSGEKAERKAYTYYQSNEDVKFLNNKLQKYQEKGFGFKGYYHKHPSGMYQLSDGDIQTTKDILTSPNYKIDNFLLMGIVTKIHDRKLQLFFYVTYLNRGDVIVTPVQFKIMPKKRILSFLNCFEPLTPGASNEN